MDYTALKNHLCVQVVLPQTFRHPGGATGHQFWSVQFDWALLVPCLETGTRAAARNGLAPELLVGVFYVAFQTGSIFQIFGPNG